MIFAELETNRLFLRKFREEDFAATHDRASCPENVKYMIFGPNTEEETRAFIRRAVELSEEEDCRDFQYAAVLKETGGAVGGAGITLNGETAEVGWMLHRNYWNRGLGAEIARALVDFGFGTLKLHRIIAVCDAENYPSYHVMEKTGMRREGRFVKARRGNRALGLEWRDELAYGILREEWELITGDTANSKGE